MKAASTNIPSVFAPRTTPSIRRPKSVAVRCSCDSIWHRNFKLFEKYKAEAECLRRDIYIRSVEPPTPALAHLHGQLRGMEISRDVAHYKLALLQAENTSRTLEDIPWSTRQIAIDAAMALSQLGRTQETHIDMKQVWGRWSLLRNSAPSAFRPVAPDTLSAAFDTQQTFALHGVFRRLAERGSYCDTLALGNWAWASEGTLQHTGKAEYMADGRLRMTPQWINCAIRQTLPCTDVCHWPAYDMPLRFVDADVMIVGEPQDDGPALQAWVRCDR